jgi:hypothetical protein
MPRVTKDRVLPAKKVRQAVISRLDTYIEKKGIEDPRKSMFLKAYFDPGSPTFSNGYQSALVAGFSRAYARQIVGKNAQSWIQDFRKSFQEKILNKAEIRGWDLMHSTSDKVAADMTKFFLSTLGKDTYSQKTLEDHRHLHMHQLDPDQVKRILETMNK